MILFSTKGTGIIDKSGQKTFLGSVNRESKEYTIHCSQQVELEHRDQNFLSPELPETAIHVTYPNQAIFSHLFV